MVKVKQLGHVVLRVNDLKKSESFYRGILGLSVTTRRPTGTMIFLSSRNDASHELALIQSESEINGDGSSGNSLVHFAWEMETLEDVQEIHRKCVSEQVEIRNVADHGVSLGFYISDPDGNEIELFYELPSSTWPQEGYLFAGEFPGSLEGAEAKKVTEAELTSGS